MGRSVDGVAISRIGRVLNDGTLDFSKEMLDKRPQLDDEARLIFKHLKRKGGLTHTDLIRRVSYKMKADEVKRVVELLESSGLVARERRGELLFYAPRMDKDVVGQGLNGLPARDAQRLMPEELERQRNAPVHLAAIGAWAYRGHLVAATSLEFVDEDEMALRIERHILRKERDVESIREQVRLLKMTVEGDETHTRSRIPEAVRMYVWQRDGGKCVHCGSTKRLEFDHVIPVSKGGSNSEKNIELLCRGCNARKRDRLTVDKTR